MQVLCTVQCVVHPNSGTKYGLAGNPAKLLTSFTTYYYRTHGSPLEPRQEAMAGWPLPNVSRWCSGPLAVVLRHG